MPEPHQFIRALSTILVAICLQPALNAAPPGHPKSRARNKPAPLVASAVNNPAIAVTLFEGDTGPAVLRAQILLDRSGLSVGEIDGRVGKNTFRAVSGLRAARGWAESE